MSGPAPADGIDTVAAVSQRLAVLLAAGVSPRAAWSYLIDDPGLAAPSSATGLRARFAGSGRRERGHRPALGPVVAASAAAERGESAAEAIADEARRSGRADADAWRGLAAAWFVATESGAPLAQSLRDLAASFRSLAQTKRELSVALAGPASTARVVMVLPAVGLLFGLGMGFDTVGILFTTAPGLICLTAGALLVVAGWRWNRRLVSVAQPKDLTPGLGVDLMAVAMAGGVSLERARTLTAEAADRYGLSAGSGDRVASVVSLSARAGVPAAELLRSEADQARREATSAGQRAASSLAVRLMIPLGVCILPAFMLVGVAPLLMAVVSSTIGNF